MAAAYLSWAVLTAFVSHLLLQGFGPKFAESAEYMRGLEGIQCPDPPPLIPDIIPCNYDCITNHAAYFGTCTKDGTYNCICDSSGKNRTKVPCTYFNPLVLLPYVCQCASEDFDELVPTELFPEVHNYQTTCDNDCRCNHGSPKGTCDYKNHQCICDYPKGFVWSSTLCRQPFGVVYNVTQVILNFLHEYCEHHSLSIFCT